MKALIALALASLSAPALASPEDFCKSYMPCGTFSGSGNNYDLEGKATGAGHQETITITPISEKSARVQVKMVWPGERENYLLDAPFEFSADGRYEAKRKDGSVGAFGVCLNFACTFNFMPHKSEGHTVTNVNLLRFEGNKLKREMMVTWDLGAPEFQRSELTKQ